VAGLGDSINGNGDEVRQHHVAQLVGLDGGLLCSSMS
jgi:hypothetical protein